MGLPLVLAGAVLGWFLAGALAPFVPVGPGSPGSPAVRVQPLTDQEAVSAFALRVDLLAVPVPIAPLPRELVRVRSGDGPPPEWWWPWAESQGWARSEAPVSPVRTLKFGVYRLSLEGDSPSWVLTAPELVPPGTETPAP